MESIRLGIPTLVLILVYLAGINVLGAWIGRGQKDARDPGFVLPVSAE